MGFRKNVNSLSDEELMKISGGIIYPREMPEIFFPAVPSASDASRKPKSVPGCGLPRNI